MRILYFIFLLFVVQCSLIGQNVPSLINSNDASNEQTGNFQQSPKWMVCDSAILELDTLPANETRLATWLLKNVSEDSVVLYSLQTLCGGGILPLNNRRRIVAPGDTVTVSAHFMTPCKQGEFRKYVLVKFMLAYPHLLNISDDSGASRASQNIGLRLHTIVEKNCPIDYAVVYPFRHSYIFSKLKFTPLLRQSYEYEDTKPAGYTIGVFNGNAYPLEITSCWTEGDGERYFKVNASSYSLNSDSTYELFILRTINQFEDDAFYIPRVCTASVVFHAGNAYDTVRIPFPFTPNEVFYPTDSARAPRARWDTTAIRIGALSPTTDTTVSVRLWNDGQTSLLIRRYWFGSYDVALSDTVVKPGKFATLRLHIPAVPPGTHDNHNPVFNIWVNDPRQPEQRVRFTWWRE